MNTITVSQFYNSSCPTKSALNKLVEERNRPMAFKEVVIYALEKLKEGKKLSEKQLNAEFEKAYTADFFAYDWQRKQAVIDDSKRILRYLGYLGRKLRVVEIDYPVAVQVGETVVKSRVDLIYEKDGKYHAVIIKTGKANKSPAGKSVHTSTKTDLYMMTAKRGLESSYEGIIVSLVYLANSEDTDGNIGDFVVANSRKSNIFTETYKDFYEDADFDAETFTQAMADVMSKKPEADCYNCFQKSLCALSTVENMDRSKAMIVEDTAKEYKIPDFTKTQQSFVESGDGQYLVLAGPGSGKTAVLVGRAKYLSEHGVDPETQLIVTFTNKAAGELQDRCKATMGDVVPKCCTIHSLAHEILRLNKSVVGEFKVLSQYEKMSLVRELTDDCTEAIAGFKYGSGEEGKREFQKNFASRLDMLQSIGLTEFKAKYPQLGNDFYVIADDYFKIIKARRYLTFDQIIKTCIKLFKVHPEALAAQVSLYKYVMVDEFQDVDRAQAEFIYMLAGSNGNLAVVGDDDQSIYGFRGGTNKYMLDFKKRFPGARTIVLEKNFRSGTNLVAASQKLIAGNKERLEKHILAERKGGKQVFVDAQDAKSLVEVIGRIREDGYSYEEVAVLASKNATLEGLAKEMPFPVTLGKSFLIDSPLFRVCLDLMSIYYDKADDAHMVHFLTIMGVDVNAIAGSGDIKSRLIQSGYMDENGNLTNTPDVISKSLQFMAKMEQVIKDGCTAFYFIDTVTDYFDMAESSVAAAFDEVLTKQHIKTMERLFEVFKSMADFDDDTRLQADQTGSVLFITSHESKGMEFPVVILVDDFKDDISEELKRLYYVAMTRAKDQLYVMKHEGRTDIYEQMSV